MHLDVIVGTSTQQCKGCATGKRWSSIPSCARSNVTSNGRPYVLRTSIENTHHPMVSSTFISCLLAVLMTSSFEPAVFSHLPRLDHSKTSMS